MVEQLVNLVSKIKKNGNLTEEEIKEFQEKFGKEEFQKFIDTELPELLPKKLDLGEIVAWEEEPKDDPSPEEEN